MVQMIKKSNIKLNIFLTIVVFLGLAYSGAWYYAAYKINRSLLQFQVSEAPAMGLEIYGGMPKINGFPFQHRITYYKGIKYKNILLAFPTLTFEGFPISGAKLKINFPNGLKALDNRKEFFKLDKFYAEFIMPKYLPKTRLKKHLMEWQKDIGEIEFTELKIGRKEMKINAQGSFGLDTELQIKMDMAAKISGYEKFIQFFVKSGTLKPLPAAIAISALRSRAKKDSVTNENHVEFPMQIINRNFIIGPISILKLPTINWLEPRGRKRP